MIELIPVPPERNYTVAKYDYVTPDGRWRLEKHRVCGGPAWQVIDTTGEYELAGWWGGPYGCAAEVRTLTAAKAFIAEWSV